MKKKFYVTTPIYYANWVPHIGHAYTSFLSDIIARSKRLLWYNVKFSTWLDENWQKMMQTAQDQWKDVIDFLDEVYQNHLNTWEKLQISYTDYIRTTETRHHEFIKDVLKKCEANWDIYKWKYEWLYCVWCEAFKKELDLIKNDKWELVCPDHLKKPDVIVEENYFFRLSKYRDFLLELYKYNPNFVFPDFRFNEIKAIVEWWLDDFSVSRKWFNNDFRIKFPLDETHVVYIWFDALFNYLTVCQNWDEEFWPADLHVMAKDIVRFHSIYWPAMLKSAWYPIPKQVLAHWYFTVDGQKMSKSLGNVIEPIEIVEKYGRDWVILYLFSDIVVGNDWNFSWDKFKWVYNSILLGGWWNLVSRVVSLAQKNWVVKGKFYEDRFNLLRFDENLKWNRYFKCMDTWFSPHLFICELPTWNPNNSNVDLEFRNDIEQFIDLVNFANKFMQDTQPWVKLKSEDSSLRSEWQQDLEFLLYMIRQIGILSSPFLVEWFEKLKNILGDETIVNINTGKDWWLEEWQLKSIFDIIDFDVNLNPGHLYTRVE